MRSLVSLLFLPLSLWSCDATNDIAVIQVNNTETLDNLQLKESQVQKNLATNTDTYYFGFDLRASPQEDAAQYLPFLNYLSNKTGYQFQLHFTPKNSSTALELGQGVTQFAAMGASGFLYAQLQYDAISLARGLNHLNKAEYQSVFVVKPESHINKLEDIRGKTLAFGSRDSTQGHLIPRIMLIENGIKLTDLANYAYTGSHQNCAEAVISGKYDVCGMQDALAKSLEKREAIKIIHASRYFPSSGIVANKSVPETVRNAVKAALLDFDPEGREKAGLYNWNRTEMPKGFIESRNTDYQDLRNWSIRLGLLSLPATNGDSEL